MAAASPSSVGGATVPSVNKGTTPDDSASLSPTSSALAGAEVRRVPSVTITPSSPTIPSDSPLAGRSAGVLPDPEPVPTASTSTTSAPANKPATLPSSTAVAAAPGASSSSRTSPTAAPRATIPARSTPASSHQKKRKRKGFAGLLLALGCLSASDFEDDKPAAASAAASGSAAAGNGAPEKAGVAPSPGLSTGEKAAEPVGAGLTVDNRDKGPTQTANTTLVGHEGGKDIGAVDGIAGRGEDVVVAPSEPVILPSDETAGMTSSAVQPPGSGSELLSTPRRPSGQRRDSSPSSGAGDVAGAPVLGAVAGDMGSSAEPSSSGGYSQMGDTDTGDEDQAAQPLSQEQEYDMADEYEDEEDRLIAQGGIGIPLDEHGNPAPLLPVLDKQFHGKKCLVLDLDETLLHSSFKMLSSADYIVPVEIEGQVHNVYVVKRPGVDLFLQEMGKIYEVVVFTASLSKYADPVLDMLDPARIVQHRLFRESCYNHKGNYVKDLSQLGRPMETCIIIDNSPASYIFHPNNAVPISTWFNDAHDTELTDLCPFLSDLATVDDVRAVLDGSL